MKKLLIGAVLAVIMSFAFAAVASAQSNSTCEQQLGPVVCHLPIDPQTGTACPVGTIPTGDACGPDPNATLAQQQAGTAKFNANLAAAEAKYGQQTTPATTPMTTAAATPAATTSAITAPVAAPATTSTTAALPNTGGPVILLPAAALLVAGGLLAFGLARRR